MVRERISGGAASDLPGWDADDPCGGVGLPHERPRAGHRGHGARLHDGVHRAVHGLLVNARSTSSTCLVFHGDPLRSVAAFSAEVVIPSTPRTTAAVIAPANHSATAEST